MLLSGGWIWFSSSLFIRAFGFWFCYWSSRGSSAFRLGGVNNNICPMLPIRLCCVSNHCVTQYKKKCALIGKELRKLELCVKRISHNKTKSLQNWISLSNAGHPRKYVNIVNRRFDAFTSSFSTLTCKCNRGVVNLHRLVRKKKKNTWNRSFPLSRGGLYTSLRLWPCHRRSLVSLEWTAEAHFVYLLSIFKLPRRRVTARHVVT